VRAASMAASASGATPSPQPSPARGEGVFAPNSIVRARIVAVESDSLIGTAA